jgi:DNA processing protein
VSRRCALPHAALVALLRAFGSPGNVLAASRAQLSAVVPDAVVARLLAPPAEETLARTSAWLAVPGHNVVAWDDTDYPKALLQLGYAPPVLFFVGRRELLNRPALAIVGSRNATAQGTDNARNFARALAGGVINVERCLWDAGMRYLPRRRSELVDARAGRRHRP